MLLFPVIAWATWAIWAAQNTAVSSYWYYDIFTGTNDDQLTTTHIPNIVNGFPGIAVAWESGGTTWTIQNNSGNNAPNATGAELHADANAASDPNTNEADAITGYTIVAGLDLGSNVFESQGGTKDVGSYALHADANDTPTSDAGFYKDVETDWSLALGRMYTMSFRWRHIGSGDQWFAKLGPSANAGGLDQVDFGDVFSTDTTFQDGGGTFEHTASTKYLVFKEAFNNNNGGVYVDNLSCKSLELNEQFVSDDMGITEGTFSVNVTMSSVYSGVAGLVLCMDSAAAPSNFIMAYYNLAQGNIHLVKSVADGLTSLIDTAVAYSAGAVLRVVLEYVAGTDDVKATLFYNGSQVGVQQTILDDGVAGNTRHGMMNTDTNNSLDNFTVII